MGKTRSNVSSTIQFHKVTNLNSLVPILENRLPRSCNVYNMAQRFPEFQKEMTFYVLNSDVSNSAWIIATYLREDYGMDINISAPPDQAGIEDFKATLISSKLIDWTKPFIFAAIDQDITHLVQDVIFEVMGKHPKADPNIMFYASPEYTIWLETNGWKSLQWKSGVELKAMEPKQGAMYLFDNWKFSKTGSLVYMEKLVERNGSAGVFKDGQLISGVTLNGSGLISMLNTLPEYRLQGYAELCMKFFIKNLAKQKTVPCCTVECGNAGSIALQQKIGLTYSHQAFYISRPV